MAPWKKIKNPDYKVFSKNEEKLPLLGLRRLPFILHYKFLMTGIQKAKSLSDAQQISSTIQFQSATNDLIRYLEKKSKKIGTSEPHSIYFGEPNLTTTTYNRNTKSFLGLHLDCFEAFKSSYRHSSKNRICLNLGLESRYMYVIPIRFDSIKKLLNHEQEDYTTNTTDLISQLLVKYPKFPVIRLQIDSFEYYVAGTENFIHDGSTIGTTMPDINLAIRGFFN